MLLQLEQQQQQQHYSNTSDLVYIFYKISSTYLLGHALGALLSLLTAPLIVIYCQYKFNFHIGNQKMRNNTKNVYIYNTLSTNYPERHNDFYFIKFMKCENMK